MSKDWPSFRTSGDLRKFVPVAVIAVVVVSLAASTAMFGSSGVTAKPTVAVDGLDIQDPDPVTTDTVEYVSVGGPLYGSVSWSHTPEPVERITFDWYVTGPDGEKERVGGYTCKHTDAPALCGFEHSTNGTIHVEDSFGLLGSSSWEGQDFVPVTGETKETQLDVILEVELFWDGGSKSDTASDTVTVAVTNPDESGGTSTSTPGETTTQSAEIGIDVSGVVAVGDGS
jgi:hypothetical protein